MLTMPMFPWKRSEFKRLVKKSNGKVVLLVHPFFPHDSEEGAVAYKKNIAKLARSAKAPLVVLEEWNKKRKTKKRLNAQFIYPTIKGYPTPLLGWNFIHLLFKQAGVKTVLIGGAYSLRTISTLAVPTEVAKHEAQIPRRPINGCGFACVAETYKQMIAAGHPKVRLLPAMVFPDKPKYER